MIFDSQEQLDACLAYWQKVLRLQDWGVKARIVRRSALDDETNAHVSVTWNKKNAFIELLDPIDYSSTAWAQDHEKSLVHELLHIHITAVANERGAWEEGMDDMMEEQAIESLATSFVKLNRK